MDIVQIGQDDSHRFSGFSAAVYAGEKYLTTPLEFANLYEDDRRLAPFSIFFALCFAGEDVPIAGMRVAIKTLANSFLIEEKLHLDIDEVIRERKLKPKNIWHCGRIGIFKPTLKTLPNPGRLSLAILKTMIRELYSICLTDKSNIMFGENLKQTDRLYRMLGFPLERLIEADYNSKVTLIGSMITGKDAEIFRKKSTWLT